MLMCNIYKFIIINHIHQYSITCIPDNNIFYLKLIFVLGLMCSLAPENSKKDPSKRKFWKKYNTYFDESTIKCYENHFTRIKNDTLLKYMKNN